MGSDRMQRGMSPLATPDTNKVKMMSSTHIPKRLCADSMRMLLGKVREGERNTSRSIISSTLNVNDVVAEYCLRHLEEKLREEKDYEDRVLRQIMSLPESTPHDLLQFVKYAFGVRGVVSNAIVKHIRTIGV